MQEATAMNLESPPKLPSQQQAIYERCFHPAGTFVEFEREEIEQSIPAKFEQQVRRFPERLAIKSGAQELTYDELNQAANRVAQAVLARGGREQQPVALLFEHGPSAIIGLLGVLKAGKICVPLDPMYPSARLASQLKDSQVILTVTNNRNLSLAEELAQSGRQWINVDEIDTGPSVENPELPLSPDSLAYILFTSGSTGRAKGVVQNHRIPIHRAMQHTNSYHICMEDRIGHLWSYSSGSSVREIFAALLNGATLNPFSLKEKGVDQLANWLIEEGITICYTGPPVFRHFVGVSSASFDHPVG
jgi:non-ribosomal peptide synthetase component F